MSVKLPDNFQIREHSRPCLFHISLMVCILCGEISIFHSRVMGKKLFTNIVWMLTTGVSCALGAAVYFGINSSIWSVFYISLYFILFTRAAVVVIVWWLDLQLHVPMISVPITTYVVSSNLDQGEVYNIVTKFASGWRQVGSFLRVLRFPPPIQLKYCWKWRQTPSSKHIINIIHVIASISRILHSNTDDSVICEGMHFARMWKALKWLYDFNIRGVVGLWN